MSADKRVLVASIASKSGGLQQMGHLMGQMLREEGYEPVFAYYMPYSLDPDLSVPLIQIPSKKISCRSGDVFAGYENHAIGAWLPELEFTHYWLTEPWKRVIDSCGRHISVSGNCLAAGPYLHSGIPFLSWVATPWYEDRKDRVQGFPWYRKLLDASFNSHVLRRLEKQIIKKGTILALSRYTEDKLNEVAEKKVVSQILRMPVDERTFFPDRRRTIKGRIAFVGRFSDPRKNIGLMLEAVSLCRKSGVDISVELVGDELDPSAAAMLSRLGIADHVTATRYVQHSGLPAKIQEFDLFVIPSFQEGLCIAGLEAMSCGCPVISTRCGGPEEFVIDGQTGYLVDFDAGQLADAIGRIVSDRRLRETLSENAVGLVRQEYNPLTERSKFWAQFNNSF